MTATASPLRRARALAAFAFVALVASLGCGPDDPLEPIREMQRSGRFAASIEPLRDLIDHEGYGNPEVQYLYGRALVATGKPSLALFPLREAMKNPEWTVRAGMQLASGAMNTGNAATAVEALDAVLAVDPENTVALAARASARGTQLRDYAGALEDADRALEIDPDFVDALVPRAIALLGLQRADEAEAALDDLEARFSDGTLGADGSARYCTARGMFNSEKGDDDKAIEVFDTCLERFPAAPIVVDTAIKFFDKRGEKERSLEILRKAHEAAPTERDLRLALAVRLPADEAEALLLEATKDEHPLRQADAWTDLAGHYMQRERVDDGIDAFEHALAILAKPPPDFLFAMADALVRGRRFDRALELVDQMEVGAHRAFIKGRVHMERGEWTEALAEFKEGARLWPDNAVGRYLAARCAERVGDFDLAIEEYRNSIRVDPGATDARERLARIHLAEGVVGHAVVALQTDLANNPRTVDAALLEIEIFGRSGAELSKLPPGVVATLGTPQHWGRALAVYAAGVRQRGGPVLAAKLVESAPGLDLELPGHAPALISLVGDLVATGETERARSLTAAALRAHDDVAGFHAANALVLLSGDELDAGLAELDRTVELAPDDLELLLLAGRLRAANGQRDAALAAFARASALDEDDARADAAAGELLASSGRVDDAEARLREALARAPWSGPVALRLAKLLDARDGSADAEEITALAQRALRFRAGPEAQALLDSLGAPGPAAGSDAEARTG